MALTLDTLKFGDLNIVKENDDNHAGDRRRTSPLTALRFATEKAFEKDTLIGVSEFVGVVVGKRQIDFATHEYQGTLINTSLLPKPQPGGSRPRSTSNWLYRVYIPELEPLPAPKSYSDPVLLAYKEIPIDLAMAGTNLKLNEGDVVRVRYQDANNLFGPKIIKKVMEATPEWDIQPVGDVQRQRAQPTSAPRSENGSDDAGPPYVPSTTPTTPQTARTAAGTNKSQAGIIWRPTGDRVYNGMLHRGKPRPGGDSVRSPNNPPLLSRVKTKTAGGRSQSLRALTVCIPDFEALQEAYNQTFAGTKYIGHDFMSLAGFYRTYHRQLSLKEEKPTLAAIPGTSNHGWGLSFDMNSTVMLTGDGFSSPSRWTSKTNLRKEWFHDMKIAWKQSYPEGRRPGTRRYVPADLPDKYILENKWYKKIKWEMDTALKQQSIKWRWLNRYAADDYNFVLTVVNEAWHFDWKRRPEFYHMNTTGMTSESEKELAKKGKWRVNATPKRKFGHGVSFLKIGPKDKPWEGAEAGVGPFGGEVRPHFRPDPKPQTGTGAVDFGDLEPSE
jgi:hypothetical protein